jgi:FkbM family methyltransferase
MISISRIIKTILPGALLTTLKKIKSRLSKYHSINGLDKKIERYLPYNLGYFVELGANDGIRQSNTLYFERKKKWRGILIEPTPHNYLKCLDNRSSDNHIFCNACVSFDYKDRFVEIAFSDLMSSPIGLESDILDPKAHADSGSQFLKGAHKTFTFGALAEPLHNLLSKAKAPKNIDFLSLDVEGAEIEVLKGIDHKSYRFKYMLIECRDIAKLQQYLTPLRYELIEKLSSHDYFFADKSA